MNVWKRGVRQEEEEAVGKVSRDSTVCSELQGVQHVVHWGVRRAWGGGGQGQRAAAGEIGEETKHAFNTAPRQGTPCCCYVARSRASARRVVRNASTAVGDLHHWWRQPPGPCTHYRLHSRAAASPSWCQITPTHSMCNLDKPARLCIVLPCTFTQ